MNIIPSEITNSNSNNFHLSYGLGAFISKIEFKILNFFLSLYKNLTKFLKMKYQYFLKFFSDNILNSHKLTFYSKIIVLISLCLMLIKFIANVITTKNNKIERPSLAIYKFFNNQVIKNKSSLLDKEHQIKIVNNDEYWLKIKKFVEIKNKNLGKINSLV